MKRKLLSVVVTLSLVATTLFGCGKSFGINSSETDKSSNTKQHLTVWAWDKDFNIARAIENCSKLLISMP